MEDYRKIAIKLGQTLFSKAPETREDVERMLPELKESEDERIKKEMLTFFKGFYDNQMVKAVDVEPWIAWLEKQGEHANFRNKIQIGDKVTRNEDGVLVNLSQLNRVAKKDEKQGEQKPVDKVEPKFRKGDWVVYCNDDVDLITGIEENGYSINNSGYIPFICENEMRLWNITDAKVGDVLVSESNCGLGTWYCIFKSLDGDESMTVYCYLARDGRFETKKELCFDKDPYNTKPATKEQRDLLFQKMKEAGYEWDADKKELRKIGKGEQKSAAWSEEDELHLRELESLVKQVWAVAEHKNDKDTIHKMSDLSFFLKTLKPQLKQEWSEEDETMITDLSVIVHTYFSEISSIPFKYDLSEDKIRTWLKSLKNRYTWKPSDEQMVILDDVIRNAHLSNANEAGLIGLYNDLKKLTE